MVPLSPTAQPRRASTKNTLRSRNWLFAIWGAQVAPPSELCSTTPGGAVPAHRVAGRCVREAHAFELVEAARVPQRPGHRVRRGRGARHHALRAHGHGAARRRGATAALSAWPVTDGCTMNHETPRSWVPTMTPPSPTAQPSFVPANMTLLSVTPPRLVLLPRRPAVDGGHDQAARAHDPAGVAGGEVDVHQVLAGGRAGEPRPGRAAVQRVEHGAAVAHRPAFLRAREPHAAQA